MGTDSPILSLSHATLRYEHGICALDDASLNITAGERICVLGPNGSGKSTLASVLCGLLAPDEGTVSLVGEQVLTSEGIDFDAYRRARRQIGLVFQNPDDQIVTSVVEEDVAFGPENLGVPSDQIGGRVARELHQVGLDQYAKADPTHLSGGQKQRVAIAGALAMEPHVLVLDEPGALLDVRGRRGIMRVMDKLHQAGTTIVHVTHFMEEALAADRVLVLSKGRLIFEGTPNEVFSHNKELADLGLEEPFVAQLSEALQGLGIAVPWTCNEEELLRAIARMTRTASAGVAEEADGEGCSVELRRAALADASGGSEDCLRDMPVACRDPKGSHKTEFRSCHAHRPERSCSARSTEHPSPSASSATPADAVRAQAVSYSYGDTDAREARHPALDGVSFLIPKGSYTTIVGQTGSGKSTLLRLLCALEAPDAGQLLVDGIDTLDRKRRRLLHGRVGYVMQHPERQLFAETVLEDVAYGPINMGLDKSEVALRCRQALQLVGLAGREDASPFHLSGGQQRLCALAGVLAMEPHILVLDEPMAGLDPHGRAQLRSIIRNVNELGVTVIQVTHSMDDAAASNQVIVLNEGKVLLQGTPDQVFSAQTQQILHDNGLGLPNALSFSLELEHLGVEVGNTLTTDQLVQALAPLLLDSGGEEASHGV